MRKVVIIDNYDSFTYNVKHYFEALNCFVLVYKNNTISVNQLKEINPSHIILSPGPGSPDDSGITMQVIKEFQNSVPLLGVCLGHQCIAKFYGGVIKHAKHTKHAKNSVIQHCGNDIYVDIPNNISVTRYHSLIVDITSIPPSLEILSWTFDGNEKVIMGLKHAKLPIYGVQYHPEAILSEYGYQLFDNFLNYGEKYHVQ